MTDVRRSTLEVDTSYTKPTIKQALNLQSTIPFRNDHSQACGIVFVKIAVFEGHFSWNYYGFSSYRKPEGFIVTNIAETGYAPMMLVWVAPLCVLFESACTSRNLKTRPFQEKSCFQKPILQNTLNNHCV